MIAAVVFDLDGLLIDSDNYVRGTTVLLLDVVSQRTALDPLLHQLPAFEPGLFGCPAAVGFYNL